MTSVLVLGGARSGKSRYAEELLADARRVRYVATGAVPDGADDEWAARVAEHRRRRPPHWQTVETADPAAVIATRDAPILLDCLGTWLTRLIDDAHAWDDPARADAVRERAGTGLVAALRSPGGAGGTAGTPAPDVVLVSNEVGSGVVPATPSGRLFRDQLGRLNAQVAAACDRVVLVVAGRVIDLPHQAVGPPADQPPGPPTDQPPGPPTGQPSGPAPAQPPPPPRERVGAPAPEPPASSRPSDTSSTRDAWRLAVGTLTAWPISPPRTVNRRVAGRAMLLAPLVKVPLLALLAVPALAAAHWNAPPLVVAALLVAVLVLATRGMHLDGLADTCDGLSAGYDRERALAVMRTGDVGPSGAGAIALVLLVQTVSLAELLGRSPAHLVTVAVAVLASRHVLAWGCRRGIPAARPEGLGAAMAESVGPAPLVATAVALAGGGALAAWACGTPWWPPLVVVAVAVGAAASLFARATRRLGGITGDVLGAAIEIALAATLAAAALLR